MLSKFVLFFGAVALFIAVGCGGSGGSTGTNGTNPSATTVVAQVPIDWAQRARSFAGPESALSAVIVFSNISTGVQETSQLVTRNTSAAAYSQTYATTAKIPTGAQSLSIAFYADNAGVGGLVGSASAAVQVQSNGTLTRADGSALGTIQSTGTIASLQIDSPASIETNQAATVVTTAFSATNSIVAVSPGSVSYQVTNGTGSATINAQGQIVGGLAGTVSLVATVDGISSPPIDVTIVQPSTAVAAIAQPTSAMVLDTKTGHLWASVPSTDAAYGNSVIEIDPASEKVISSIPVGSDPTVLAISDDGTAVYVSVQGANSIARVDPIGKTVVSTFTVTPAAAFTNSSQYASSIAVQPGNPNVIAVCQQDLGDSGFVGGCIYNNGTLLSNNMGTYNGNVLGFSSPTTLWGSDPGFSPESLFEGQVGSSGATLVNNNRSLGGIFRVFGGDLYFENGQVVSGATGNLLGTFSLSASGDVAVDTTANLAYYVETTFNSGVPRLEVFSNTTFKPVSTAALTLSNGSAEGTIDGVNLLGSNGLAFRDPKNVYFMNLVSPSLARTHR